jgi:hypothetical protein
MFLVVFLWPAVSGRDCFLLLVFQIVSVAHYSTLYGRGFPTARGYWIGGRGFNLRQMFGNVLLFNVQKSPGLQTINVSVPPSVAACKGTVRTHSHMA